MFTNAGSADAMLSRHMIYMDLKATESSRDSVTEASSEYITNLRL